MLFLQTNFPHLYSTLLLFNMVYLSFPILCSFDAISRLHIFLGHKAALSGLYLLNEQSRVLLEYMHFCPYVIYTPVFTVMQVWWKSADFYAL